MNLQILFEHPNATFPYQVGYEEELFIRALAVTYDELEPKANNCTEVLVWHSKTSPSIAPDIKHMTNVKGYNDTYLPDLYNNVLH